MDERRDDAGTAIAATALVAAAACQGVKQLQSQPQQHQQPCFIQLPKASFSAQTSRIVMQGPQAVSDESVFLGATAANLLVTASSCISIAALAGHRQRRAQRWRFTSASVLQMRAGEYAAGAGSKSSSSSKPGSTPTNAAAAAVSSPSSSSVPLCSGEKGSSRPMQDPDKTVEELEGKLHTLVEAEDYKAAAELRDELSLSQLDDEAFLLSANSQFYSLFSKRDHSGMKALWLQAPFVQCIHPYTRRSSGYSEVCASWESLFKEASHKNIISPNDVRVHVRGATATVTCYEQILSKRQNRFIRAMLATHVFRKVSGRWLLVHRHVSLPLGASATLLDDEPVHLGELMPDADDSSAQSRTSYRLGQMARAAANFQGLALPAAQIIINPLGNTGQGFGSDEDNDEDHDDEDGSFGEVINGYTPEQVEGGSNSSDEDHDDLDEDDEGIYVADDGGDEDVMEVARDTVRALRQLFNEGKIDQQAKMRLLADMIQNPGESMPERAHKLLLSEVPDHERQAAWEDFAMLITSLAAKQAQPQSKASGNHHNKGKSQQERK
eukprot:TRINITY_DN30310_c0_g1_i2.p1 TRINITY_DN30310_c0_g1~~TRINITY_DN30310_c0_g1_i2.p1  ORF type:complete len:553 (+),score=126.08 TRINITY_DN30310_c0_g1_i2:173-1831(+)